MYQRRRDEEFPKASQTTSEGRQPKRNGKCIQQGPGLSSGKLFSLQLVVFETKRRPRTLINIIIWGQLDQQETCWRHSRIAKIMLEQRKALTRNGMAQNMYYYGFCRQCGHITLGPIGLVALFSQHAGVFLGRITCASPLNCSTSVSCLWLVAHARHELFQLCRSS